MCCTLLISGRVTGASHWLPALRVPPLGPPSVQGQGSVSRVFPIISHDSVGGSLLSATIGLSFGGARRPWKREEAAELLSPPAPLWEPPGL